MSVKERIQIARLIKKIENQIDYANKVGLSCSYTKPVKKFKKHKEITT